jgi:microcompartment protein CcmL/EutN
MKNSALGMIETYGYVGAIEAADVCLKAANITLLGCEFVKGGLVTIHIIGDVGAVKASIDAAETAVKKIGRVVSTHVIPRPSDEVEKILPTGSLESQQNRRLKPYVNEERENVKAEVVVEVDAIKEVEEKDSISLESEQSPKSREALTSLKALDLRALARKIDDQYEGTFPIERSQIKYARKEELIEAILKFYKGVK